MKTASDIFEEALHWIIDNYEKFGFHKERDIAWTMQKKITEIITDNNLPYKVYDEYPIKPGNRRSICVDIAILDKDSIPKQGNTIEVAAEFKYEPDHKRDDMLTFYYDSQGNKKTKFPLVFWKDGVGKDIENSRDYFLSNLTKTSYSIFIDEGGYFHLYIPFAGSKWIDYPLNSDKTKKISVLFFKLPAN
jgi:hypothetical protein